jgi:Fe-S-cluster containining protein
VRVTLSERARRLLATAPALDLPDVIHSLVRDLSPPPPPKRAVTCSSGCSACCSQHVGALVPEVILLARAIDVEGGDGAERRKQRDAFAAHLAAQASLIRGTTTYRRQVLRVKCGLLAADGTCVGYEYRPSMCRAENSVEEREKCDKPLSREKVVQIDLSRRGRRSSDPIAARNRMWAASHSLAGEREMDGATYHHYRGVSLAVRDALKARGLDHRGVELTLALDLVLRDPGAVSKWALGDTAAFQDVLFPHSSSAGEEAGLFRAGPRS